MPYLRPALASGGRRGGPGGALRSMGDMVTDFRDFITLSGPSAAGALAAQVNRFGPEAPAAYRFTDATFPVDTVNLDPALALVALTIYQRRAADAFTQFHDSGSRAALDAADAGFSDPTGFVSAHLSDVIAAVGGFADSVGLPAATGPAAAAVSSISPAVLAVGAGLLLWWMWR